MTKKTAFIFLCLLSLFLSACSQTETSQPATVTPETSNGSATIEPTRKVLPADVVRVETPGVEIKAGNSGEATVKLTIASGFHINSNQPSFSYLKATELTVEPKAGITPGKPVYPASLSKRFVFSKAPLAVYEGETIIKLPLSATAKAQKGAQTLTGKLRVQACDEEACYPPHTLETPIPVTVK